MMSTDGNVLGSMSAHHVLFKDRQDAGIRLSEKLASYRDKSVMIVGLARGGVVTAFSIAEKLDITADVLVIKKIASPYNSEFALGAAAPDNVSLIHWPDTLRVGADSEYIKEAISYQTSAIRQKMQMYRKGKKPINIEGKTVILVDDGAATGATMETAIVWAKKKKADRIVVAIPIMSQSSYRHIDPEVDQVAAGYIDPNLSSVGEYYKSFPQVTDEEVIELVRSQKS